LHAFLLSAELAALTISVQLSAQEPVLTEFNAPGDTTVTSPACAPQCGTVPLANNDRGGIAGFYTDPNIVPHAFLRTPAGDFISFEAPGAGIGAGLDQGTVAYSINDVGAIAGQFEDSSNVFHGFVRQPGGLFSTFDVPGAGAGSLQGTWALNINGMGTTAGFYVDGNNAQHAFIRSSAGQSTRFDPSGSVATMVCEETCLNAEGAVTGFYLDANDTFHGFMRIADGTITEFNAPGTGNFLGTIAASITASISGW